LAVVLVAGCSTRPAEVSDAEMQLPPYPVAGRLVEFEKGHSNDFRFFIDPASLSVDKDGVVRYVLVARSATGSENVTYEALRCETAEHRIYAFGHADGTWSRSRTEWRPLQPQSAQARQLVLYADYFCPQKVPMQNTAEGVRALQEGGHPFAKGFAAPGAVNNR